MFAYLLILVPILIFYVAIPVAGALVIRAGWRRFRRAVIESSFYPLVSYTEMRLGSGNQGRCLGRFRFFGALEAIQGSDRIWLRGKNVSVSVAMQNVLVYLLPSAGLEKDAVSDSSGSRHLPDQTPSPVRWSRMSTLPEGVRVYVAGLLCREGSMPVFREDRAVPLLVVIYDGPDTGVIERSIWCGRQRNEYWNQYTPASLLMGSLALSFVAFLSIVPPTQRTAAVLALTGAVAPVLPLMPPGVLFHFLYRRIWTAGRVCRAERDYFGLIARLSTEAPDLPHREGYGMIRIDRDELTAYPGIETAGFARRYRSRPPAELYLCGAVRTGRDARTVAAPDDPMLPYVVLPDDPAALADTRSLKARLYENLAGIAFVLGLAINTLICMMALQYFLP